MAKKALDHSQSSDSDDSSVSCESDEECKDNEKELELGEVGRQPRLKLTVEYQDLMPVSVRKSGLSSMSGAGHESSQSLVKYVTPSEYFSNFVSNGECLRPVQAETNPALAGHVKFTFGKVNRYVDENKSG